MIPEERAAYVNAMAAQLIAKVFGMHAENMQREHRGESMAYTEQDFDREIESSGCHHNAVMGMLGG